MQVKNLMKRNHLDSHSEQVSKIKKVHTMNFNTKNILGLFLTLGLLIAGPVSQANAQDINSAVVVDIQQLEALSTAGKSLTKKVKSSRDALKAEIEKEEKSLRATQQDIMKQRDDLSEEAFKAKVMAFESSFKDKQAKFAKKREAFEKSALEAHTKLRTAVVIVVGDIAAENEYKLVLSRQSVVIVEKDSDITAEAMERLNKSVKDIPFKN